nr:MAG: hypothetical protein KatS3mg041_1527 [Bacteroidota bacterium]
MNKDALEIPQAAIAETGPVSWVRILGVRLSRITLQETIERMVRWIRSGQRRRICVVPTNGVLDAYRNAALRQIYNTADLVLPDGMPLVWASRLYGEPIPERVTGLDLFPAFCARSAREGFRFFLLGSRPEVLDTLRKQLPLRYPGLQIVDAYSPPFRERFTDRENAYMLERIEAARPDVLWVSLSAPKQDFWIAEHFDRLTVPLAIGIGAALDAEAGRWRRPPRWMQRMGLEWLARLVQEPRRLGRRYARATLFLPLLLWDVMHTRIGKRKVLP